GAEAVEAALDLLLPPGEGYPRAIHEAMRYSTLGGGKRLRGILVREAARLGGAPVDGPPGREGASEAPAPAAPGSIPLTPRVMQAAGAVGAVSAAVEMIHAYSLVHDDLPCMDDDDLRRGRPTTHKVFGEGMAVLTGDALLTRAFEVLARLPWAGVDPGAALAVTGELAVAAGTAGLIGGQVVDLESEGRLAPAGDARAAGGAGGGGGRGGGGRARAGGGRGGGAAGGAGAGGAAAGARAAAAGGGAPGAGAAARGAAPGPRARAPAAPARPPARARAAAGRAA